jgi:hypothetical protein
MTSTRAPGIVMCAGASTNGKGVGYLEPETVAKDGRKGILVSRSKLAVEHLVQLRAGPTADVLDVHSGD